MPHSASFFNCICVLIIFTYTMHTLMYIALCVYFEFVCVYNKMPQKLNLQPIEVSWSHKLSYVHQQILHLTAV